MMGMSADKRREASLECARGVRNERTLRLRPAAPQAPFAPRLKLWSFLPALQHSRAASPHDIAADLRREASLECARGVRNERTLRLRPATPYAPFAPRLKLWSFLPVLQHSKAASPRDVAADCGPKVRADTSPVRRNDGLGFSVKTRLAGRRSAQITRSSKQTFCMSSPQFPALKRQNHRSRGQGRCKPPAAPGLIHPRAAHPERVLHLIGWRAG